MKIILDDCLTASRKTVFVFLMNISIITLILAIIAVESGGNDNAVGDGGLAFGPMQMHACYVLDAAKFSKKNWTHEDAFDRETSLEIFAAYMDRYATKERLGHTPTAEDIARIHNGGPNGYKNPKTEKYWDKVKAELVKMGVKK